MSQFCRLCLLLAVPVALLASCIPNGATASSPVPSNTSPVSRDINKLGKSIVLPRRPLHAVWQVKQMGDGEIGPSDYAIKAVMQFSPGDLQALTSSAAKRAAPRLGTISVEPWFPAALKKKAQGKNGLRAQSLDPSDFYKMSFIQGDLWRIEGTNYLFVSLYTS